LSLNLSDPEKKAIYDREISKKPVPRPSSNNYSQSLRTRPTSLFEEIDGFFSTFEDFWIGSPPEFSSDREEDQAQYAPIAGVAWEPVLKTA